MKEGTCPICSADVPFNGDEKPGDEVYCAFCSAPLVVKGNIDEDDVVLDDDF